MKKITQLGLLILSLFQIEIPLAQPDSKLVVENLKEAQEYFIGQLTGRHPVLSQGVLLKERSTPKQRKLTIRFLSEKLRKEGFEVIPYPYLHSHTVGVLNLLFPPMKGTNLLLPVRATTSSQEWVFLGAHFDSESGSPGAVDNASGMALIYSVAQTLRKLKVRNRNFGILFLDQEEEDEVGSRAFAKYLKNSGRIIHSVHITDIPGWNDETLQKIEIQSPAPSIEPYYEKAAQQLGLLLRYTKGGSSDNKAFMEFDFPTVGVFSADMTPHIHRPTDTFDHVHFDFLAQMTLLVREVMNALAQEKI